MKKRLVLLYLGFAYLSILYGKDQATPYQKGRNLDQNNRSYLKINEKDDLWFYGFSKDGKHLTFRTCSEKGPNVFSAYFIDVDKNSYASNPFTDARIVDVPEFSSACEVKEAEFRKNNPTFQEMGVDKNVGVLTYLWEGKNGRKWPTFSDAKEARAITYEPNQQAPERTDFYLVHLKEIPTQSDQCENIKTEMLEVSIENTSTGWRKILQKDLHIPKSRGCPISYGIDSINTYKQKVAVFVDVGVPSAENGSIDVHHMVITGNLSEP